MAKFEDSSSQVLDPRKYLDHFYYHLNKKPGEEPEVPEFILIKLHEYMKEGRIASSTSLLHTKGIILIIILQLFIIIT